MKNPSKVNFAMMPPKKRIMYRLLLGFLAVLSFAAMAVSYLGYTINAYYFRDRSHWRDYIWIGCFAVILLVLLVAFVRTFSTSSPDEE